MEASPLFATTNRVKAELEAARERAAKILGTTPKRLLTDAALEAVVRARPINEGELLKVVGVGERTAAVLAQDVARIFGDVVIEPAEYVLVEEEPYAPEPVTEEERAVSVSAYLRILNEKLGGLGAIVRGEVTEVREYPSGVYFSIKDASGAEGVLGCYLPPYRVRMFGHLLTHGAEIRIVGAPKIAMRKGSFSFQVEAVEAVGEGALRAAYEQLKRELAEEGLFDRALPIPLCAKRIGIVTSKAGAVIDDFRKNLEQRGYQLLMHDARVEGVRAVPSILEALTWFRERPELVDVVVIMRGGGSLEDLQAFNNESVARAVASMPVPIIAAIGHDRDVPISNLAADLSTSTPSIAAMQINRSWAVADELLARSTERLARGADNVVARVSRRVDLATERLTGRSQLLVQRVRERIARATQILARHIDDLVQVPQARFEKIQQLFLRSTERLGERLLALERELAIVDPQRTLDLGYSIVTGADGKALKSVHDAPQGSSIRARLADGTITATVTDANPEK